MVVIAVILSKFFPSPILHILKFPEEHEEWVCLHNKNLVSFVSLKSGSKSKMVGTARAVPSCWGQQGSQDQAWAHLHHHLLPHHHCCYCHSLHWFQLTHVPVCTLLWFRLLVHVWLFDSCQLVPPLACHGGSIMWRHVICTCMTPS